MPIQLPETAPHFILEFIAYVVGARIYWRTAKNQAAPPCLDRWLILAAAIFGAFVGSKCLHLLEHLPFLLQQPAHSPLWYSGKSVLGGFLGGTFAVELAKMSVGWRHSTGDAWVAALAAGLMIGRLGCQFSGLWDLTYGVATSLPWGWNYGDGIPRHPVGFYEIILIGLLAGLLYRHRFPIAGTRFSLFMAGYCFIRLILDFLKPPFAGDGGLVPVALYAGLTAIQWAGIAGIVYFASVLRWRYRNKQDSNA